jgi:hypothetical protein
MCFANVRALAMFHCLIIVDVVGALVAEHARLLMCGASQPCMCTHSHVVAAACAGKCVVQSGWAGADVLQFAQDVRSGRTLNSMCWNENCVVQRLHGLTRRRFSVTESCSRYWRNSGTCVSMRSRIARLCVFGATGARANAAQALTKA